MRGSHPSTNVNGIVNYHSTIVRLDYPMEKPDIIGCNFLNCTLYAQNIAEYLIMHAYALTLKMQHMFIIHNRDTVQSS